MSSAEHSGPSGEAVRVPPPGADGACMIPARVITLPAAETRRQHIRALLETHGIPYAFVPGVDGRRMDADEIARHYDHDRRLRAKNQYIRPLCPVEIGCSLAHRGVYDAMVDAACPHGLVMEDDARFGPALPAVARWLARLFPPEEPALVLLTHAARCYPRPVAETDDGIRLRRVFKSWNATCYFVTLEAARRLRDALHPVWLVADDWEVIRHIVPVYGLDPYVADWDRGAPSVRDPAMREAIAQWRAERRWRRIRPDIVWRRSSAAVRAWGHRCWHGVRDMPESHYRA